MLRGKNIFVFTLAFFILISTGCDSNKLNEIERAQQFREQRQYSAAIIELKSILQHDVGNANVRLFLGNTYLEVEDGASAEKELRKAKSLGISDNEVVPGLARALLLQKSYDAVLKLEFEGAPAPVPMAELEASRALAYLELNHRDKAWTHLNAAQSTAPESGWVRYVQARLLIAEKSKAEAKAVLVKLVDDEPRNGIAWSFLANVYLKLGRMAEAEDAFTKAIANRTAVSLDHYRRGIARIQQGKLDAAAEDADILLRRNPTWVEAGYFAGRIKFRQKRYAEAERILSSTYQLDFRNFDVIFLLARTYLVLGSLERAEALAQSAFEMRPNSGYTRKLLAEIYLRQRKDAQAHTLLRSAGMPNSKDVPARTTSANTLMLQRPVSAPEDGEGLVAQTAQDLSIKGAKRMIALLEKVPKKDDELLFLQADAFFRLKQFDKARQALELVRARSPDSVRAHFGLAKIYKALGKSAAAEASLHQAQTLIRSRKKQSATP